MILIFWKLKQKKDMPIINSLFTHSDRKQEKNNKKIKIYNIDIYLLNANIFYTMILNKNP